MAKFRVNVEGVDYEVDAPDEKTAWSWGWQFHQQSKTQAAAPQAAAPQAAAPQAAAPQAAAQISPDVQIERDRQALQILRQEESAVAQRVAAGDPRAQADMEALQREISRMAARVPGASAAPAAPGRTPAQGPTTVPSAGAAVPPGAAAIPAATSIAAPPRTAPEVSPPSLLSQVGRQVGLTARAGAEGVAGLLGTFTDPVAALINQFVPPENRLKTLQSVMSTILTQAGVPEPANELERIVQKAAGGAAGAAKSVDLARQAAAQLAGPTGRAVAGQLAAMPGAQLAAGAGAGGATQLAAEAGMGPVGQVFAGIGGGVAGGVAASPRSVSFTVPPPQLTAVEAAAQRAGIPMMRSDISPPETGMTRGIQRAGEAVPLVGTTRPRLAQQEARVAAVRDVVRDYAGPGVTGFQSIPESLISDLLSKRSAEVNKYRNMKQDVFERLTPVGEVPLTNTMTILDDQIARLRNLQADGFAGEIAMTEGFIRDIQNTPVRQRPSDWRDALAQLRQELTVYREQDKLGKIYEPAIKILEDWKAALPGKNIQEIEQLRTSLGERFSAPELLNMRTVSEKAVSSIYKALRDDMGTFIQNNGERRDFAKWKIANARLKDQVDQLDMEVFKRTLNKGEVTPEVVENMLFSKYPSEIKQLYEGLTPNGRSVARAAIISRAAREAQIPQGAGATIDPTKFAQSVEDLGKSVNVFFSGDDLKRVEGLVKALNATRRAGEVSARAAEEPSVAKMAGSAAMVTGVAGLPLAGLYNLFGGGILGGAATTVGAGSLGAAARLYESPAVRELLRKIATAKPGDELALITQLSAIKAPAPQENK